MSIHIQTIPHAAQRYPTCGDWIWTAGPVPGDPAHLFIKVSEMGDRRYEFLVALHEMVESFLCRERGISTESVDAFDKAFAGDGEPGADPRAPYHKEHMFATRIERLMAEGLGVDWDTYDAAVEAL